jgi:hypothetical protein
MKQFLLMILTCLGLDVLGQSHLAPFYRGGNIPGPVPGSFVIAWEHVPGAVGYDYVLTDNESCTAGCAGDTRESVTADSFAVAYDLREGAVYYWISRIRYADGTASEWSRISRFEAVTPDLRPLVTLAGNPVSDDQLQISLDWAAIGYVSELCYELTDLRGITVSRQTCITRGTASRLDQATLSVAGLPAGLYRLVYTPLDREGRAYPQRTEAVMIRR